MVLIVNKPTVHVQVLCTIHQHATKLANCILLPCLKTLWYLCFLFLCLLVSVAFVLLGCKTYPGARQQLAVLHQEFFPANLVQPRDLQ